MQRDDAVPDREREVLLARAMLDLAQAPDLPELMRLARTAARALTGADGVTLVLREGDQCRYADEDAIGPLWKGHRFALTACISGWAMLHDEAVMVGDIYTDPRIPHDAYRSTFVNSLSMAPIRRGEPLGAIGCYWARQHGADAHVLRVQQALADAAALAFGNFEVQRRLAVAQSLARHSDAPRAPAPPAAPPSNEILRALRQSEARYRLLVEQAPDAIFVADRDGRFLDINRAGARMLGYSREEVVARCIGDMVAPEQIPRVEHDCACAVAGTVTTARWLLLRKDGATFPGEAVGQALPDGRLQWILRDVSERERAEAALRESESFHRQTLDSIPGLVFTTRPDGRAEYQSQQWVEYTGMPIELHVRDAWSDLLHPEDRAAALAAWHRAVAERAPYEHEYRLRRYDGGHDWFRVIARPIRDDFGGVVRWFGVAMNIEALKRAEAQRIATLTHQRDTLVREVHHRIKNHLQGVIGLLHGTMARYPDLGRALEEAIAQIQAIAQVYGLQARSSDSGLPLLALLDAAVESATGRVCVHRPMHGDAYLEIAGDHAVAIALIVNELITNAAKHQLTAEPAQAVQVSLEVAAGSAQITVRNGPARLPPGFDFAHRRGLSNGLELAADLLPDQGASLHIGQRGEHVEASLSLSAPAVIAR